jgi:REP element-mobilizing transposase RayT
MKIKLSAHGAYHHQYHVVWIPKYRKKVLKGELKQYLEKSLLDIERFHPDIEIETLSIQVDHIHLVIVIPPKYAVSDIVGKIKANTSREIPNVSPGSRRSTGGTNFGPSVFSPPRSGSTKTSSRDMLSFRRKSTRAKHNWISGFSSQVPRA